ncbi:class I SAM-dependent methyltransferase [Actinomadura flavalba]|uniref:class I SAM-dependent methyltransferase n=1 Tax=Actinomadura flavalba TaxID=1120938 RepID=UPI0003AA134C|nr:class I SAM-dependent methyltransferase [Actinomadura flavalba]
MGVSAREMKHGAVIDEFDVAAPSYDRLVGANPGYHRHLRMSARRLGLPRDGAGLRVLDLGCGTGASTAALARVLPAAEIVGVDASAGMLAAARAKRWPPNVRFVHSRAEDLTSEHTGGRVDAVFAAYLLRNCPDPDQVLRGIRGLAKPGARVALHEYSVDGPAARAVWSAVCWGVVIPAGRVFTGRTELYRYLWRSVLQFDPPAGLRARLEAAGYDTVRAVPLPGWQRGITHTFLARAGGGA